MPLPPVRIPVIYIHPLRCFETSDGSDKPEGLSTFFANAHHKGFGGVPNVEASCGQRRDVGLARPRDDPACDAFSAYGLHWRDGRRPWPADLGNPTLARV